jgi:hypothetical protein
LPMNCAIDSAKLARPKNFIALNLNSNY